MSITFNLSGSITCSCNGEAPPASNLVVWTGVTRPADGLEYADAPFALGSEFAAFAFISEGITNATISYGPPDINLDAAGHALVVQDDGGTADVSITDQILDFSSTKGTALVTTGRIGVGLIRTATGDRVHVSDGVNTYTAFIDGTSTTELYYGYINGTYSSEYEWWSGTPGEDSVDNVVSAWIAANI